MIIDCFVVFICVRYNATENAPALWKHCFTNLGYCKLLN